MLRVRWIWAALCCSVLCAAATARADDADAARDEYSKGTAAIAAKRYAEAAGHFESAAALRPHGAARFAAGKAWLLARQRAKSADNFAEAIRLGGLGPAELAEAERQLATLEAKLGTVTLSGDAALEASLDGGPRVRPPAALHADPGTHTLEIYGENGSARRDIVLRVNERSTVELRPDLVIPEPTTQRVAPPPPPAAVPDPDEGGGAPPLRMLGIVGLVGAGVGAGVAVGLGVAALGAKDDFLASPTQENYDSATTLQTATNVAWIATAVLGAAGGGLLIGSFFTGSDGAAAAGAPPAPRVWIGVGPGQMTVAGRF